MKRSMIMKLDHFLSYKSSRSAWITHAIESKMARTEEATELIAEISTLELLEELMFRNENHFSKVEKATIQQMVIKVRELPDSGNE